MEKTLPQRFGVGEGFEVTIKAYLLWEKRVKVGGSYFGDSQKDWFEAEEILHIKGD